MSKNINSASRVNDIFITVLQEKPQTKMIDMWSEIFSIKEDDSRKKSFEVSRCLNLLHDELLNIDEQMDKTDFSGELYKPFIQKSTSITSLEYLHGQQASYINALDASVILSLKFCSEILPNEENDIDEDKLEEINSLIIELENATLPSHLKNIILKNLTQIKNAIHSFKIVGIKAFHDVMKTTVGEVIVNQKEFTEEKESKEVSMLTTIWRKVQSYSDGVIKIDKTAHSGSNIIEYIDKAIDVISSS